MCNNFENRITTNEEPMYLKNKTTSNLFFKNKINEGVFIDEKEYQIKRFETTFKNADIPPILKKNTKFCTNYFNGFNPYISYDDMIQNRYAIRASPVGCRNIVDTGQRDIIIEYSSIVELVNDGWQLA